jgi:hypothetical protein
MSMKIVIVQQSTDFKGDFIVEVCEGDVLLVLVNIMAKEITIDKK